MDELSNCSELMDSVMWKPFTTITNSSIIGSQSKLVTRQDWLQTAAIITTIANTTACTNANPDC